MWPGLRAHCENLIRTGEHLLAEADKINLCNVSRCVLMAHSVIEILNSIIEDTGDTQHWPQGYGVLAQKALENSSRGTERELCGILTGMCNKYRGSCYHALQAELQRSAQSKKEMAARSPRPDYHSHEWRETGVTISKLAGSGISGADALAEASGLDRLVVLGIMGTAHYQPKLYRCKGGALHRTRFMDED
jgi:hypothetical protein